MTLYLEAVHRAAWLIHANEQICDPELELRRSFLSSNSPFASPQPCLLTLALSHIGNPSGRSSALSPDNIFDITNLNSDPTKQSTEASPVYPSVWRCHSLFICSVISSPLLTGWCCCSIASRTITKSKVTRPQHHPRIDRIFKVHNVDV